MTPILITHGALGSAHQFESILAALPPSPTFLEFYGHGTTADVDAPWTIDVFADQLANALEQAGRPHVFGYSMGGYVALTLALRRPELFASITTLGTKLEWSVQGAEREVRMLDPEVIRQKVPAFATDLQRRHGEHRWKDVLAKTAELMRDLGANPRCTPEAMAAMTVPVHYGIGDRDEMVTLEETITWYRATPGSTLHVIPKMRHPIEKAECSVVVDHILRFTRS